jgi:hypothetical protein
MSQTDAIKDYGAESPPNSGDAVYPYRLDSIFERGDLPHFGSGEPWGHAMR